jgi:hypothetical protein
MKIVHAIDDPNIIETFFEKTNIKLNILISYHYLAGNAYKLTNQYRDMIELLYLDSGAFSAEKQSVKINVSEYRRYIRRYGHKFDVVFNLDDDFNNPYHNFNNQAYLEENLPEGAKRPAPVIHDPQDPYGEFEVYADQGYELIAIGSNKQISDDVFDKIKENYPRIRLHMFGNLNRKILIKHKPYSADSASWAHTAGLGVVSYFDPEENKEQKLYIGERETPKGLTHINKFPKKEEFINMLDQQLGYDYDDLLLDYNAKRSVNLYFFQQLEDYINSQ